MKKVYLLLLIFFSTKLFAQYKLHIVLTDKARIKAERINLAGSFNSWNPDDVKCQFTKRENTWEITLGNVGKGTHQFKCTQGSWETVEDSTNGVDIANRIINLQSDTIVYINTYGWKRVEDTSPRKHTASLNVHVISDSFYMPQLKRKRKIWIYLPANYFTSKNRFPALYMQDGQNLFDDFTAPYGEWGIDEALDSLQKKTGKYCIVVGIDHGNEKRLVEYNPYDTKEYGRGEGKQYVDFIVQTLKPFIDKKYRTKKEAVHTSVAGSSLGALIATYAILKYPNTFGSAGIFSPAYWIAPDLQKFVKQTSKKLLANKIWFYGGEKEGYTMMEDMERIKNLLPQNIETVVLKAKEGEHNEKAWRNSFPAFYTWLISTNKASQ
jgi:predicted alpha/beta superfamily hydrolase